MLNEVSQTEKNISYNLPYMWNVINKQIELINTETDWCLLEQGGDQAKWMRVVKRYTNPGGERTA